jgi:DNA-binding NtrC family response regulator
VECTKVLVLDQELEVYASFQHSLHRHGYELHPTTALAQALTLAGTHQYKVALVDLSLVDKTSFLVELQVERPGIAVILMLPPANACGIPVQMLDCIANTIGKPLLLEACLLQLDRTLELASLRVQVRQYRQVWADLFTLQPHPETATEEHSKTTVLFDTMLTAKLRHIVSHLAVLGQGMLHRAVMSHVEKLLLTTVLKECRGNQLRAADILGINRNTLRKKIRELAIPTPRGGGNAA